MGKKISLSVLGILFLLFAYFQWNDPDSIKWIIYYLLVAVMCFASLIGINKPIYLYAMLALSGVWMFTLLPNAISWVKSGMPTIIESMKASTPYVELVREFLGLLISGLALLFILFLERRRKKDN